MARGSGRSDLIDLSVIVKHRTAKAVLVDHGGEEPCWLPLSQIEIEGEDGNATVTLPEWLAKDKGMI